MFLQGNGAPTLWLAVQLDRQRGPTLGLESHAVWAGGIGPGEPWVLAPSSATRALLTRLMPGSAPRSPSFNPS